MPARRLRRSYDKYAAVLAVLCACAEAQSTSSSTRTLSVTLTAGGPLGTFNPPSDCTAFSPYTTATRVFEVGAGDDKTRSFTATSFRQGCQIAGPHQTCCPPNYSLAQYNSPGVCPGGYTTHGDLDVAETIEYTADGPIPICFATTKGPTITQGASVVNQESDYFASAIIVIPPDASDSPLPTVTQTSGTSSPGESTTGAADTSTASSQARPTSTPASETSERDQQPQESASPSGGGGGSNSKGLSSGAIAGIAVGVALPLIVAGLYLAYRLGRRSKGQPVPPAADGAKMPGISEQSQIGGIQ
ncbi:hypothetical protein ABW21_db0201113 [Orbilia brochopaga]|nr:hypothetical protein ABW21_db0201113 [Drechslerella brochopaga]